MAVKVTSTEASEAMINAMKAGIPVNARDLIEAQATVISEEESTSEDDSLEVVTEDTPIPPAVVEEKARPIGKRIKTITPMNIHTSTKNNKTIAVLHFLCRDDNDNLFTLSKSYLLNTEMDISYIESLPFFTSEDIFISNKICNTYISKFLDDYLLGTNFIFEENFAKESDPIVYTTATNTATKDNVDLIMSSEIFTVINYIDSYILDSANNLHDLSLASIIGSKEPNIPSKFYVVDDVEDIVCMATANPAKNGFIGALKSLFSEEKPSTTIGVVLKVSKTIDGTKEMKYILAPFDIGVAFTEDKFNGYTMDKIQDTYYGESDQYVSTLLTEKTSVSIANGDNKNNKEYMIIRGKTKDKDVKIFLFDFSLKEKIIKLINQY